MQPALPVGSALAQRLARSPLSIFLDIDGTLAPIAPRPDQVLVPPEVLTLIGDLARAPAVHVAIVTGRSVAAARALVPVDGIGFIGNHGFEILGEDGTMIVSPEAQQARAAMAAVAREIDAIQRRHQGLILEDKTWTLSLHYRLAERGVIAGVVSEVNDIARRFGLVTTTGKEIIEVRPPATIDKGTAAVALARGVGALDGNGTPVYIGDDRTDEDAFHALRAVSSNAVTIRVGNPIAGDQSHAEFGVVGPDDVRDFLRELLTLRRAGVR